MLTDSQGVNIVTAATTDIVVVGAGFAGLYAIYKLRQAGLRVRGFEAGANVGGTWYWNRYPGARCDVPSMEYSYKFDEELQQEWQWTETYAAQPEILAYANHVADRFELREHFSFNTRVSSAHFKEEDSHWLVTTDSGEQLSARFCIMATGVLSCTNTPAFPGLDDFTGDLYHTGNWPPEGVDFSGKRVAIVGTGSSGIQSIPVIASQAEQLHVFQRTAQFSIPAQNRPLRAEEIAQIKANYRQFRRENYAQPGGVRRPENVPPVLEVSEHEREELLEAAWLRGGTNFLRCFSDVMQSREKNAYAADFAKRKIHDIVKDPALAEKLTPDQVIGCKRICLDTDYFDTYNRPNVELVDIKDHPIDRITPTGISTNGIDYEFDCLVFATGFDAMTGTLSRMDIRGRDDVSIQQKWSEGPHNYLGMTLHRFPNLFIVCGPGSPSVLANMISHIEQNVEWICDCIEYLDDNQHSTIEATAQAEAQWVAHVNEAADKTLFPTCNSWYLGVNIPGKPRVFLPYAGGFHMYTARCDEIAERGYEGFVLSL